MTHSPLPLKKPLRTLAHWGATGLLAALLTACGGGGGGGGSVGSSPGGASSPSGGASSPVGGTNPVNTAPTAVFSKTGSAEVGQTISFDGSPSFDVDGDTLRFSWTLRVPDGSKTTLDTPNATKVSFRPDRGGIYEVRLVVNDGKLDSPAAYDSLAATSKNGPPVPHFRHQVPLIPGEVMEIDGSGSRDPDGDALSFKWTVLSTPPGASASFSDASSAKPELVAQKAGDYQLKLEVSDAESTVALTLTVIVDNRPIPEISHVSRAVPGQELVLDASASSDPDGDPLTYAWEFLAMPSGSRTVLSSTTGSKVRFTPDVGGSYLASLVVYDKHTSSRSSKPAFIIVNHPPVAQISAPPSAAPNSTVMLDGSKSSDVEKSALRYAWRIITKPAGSQAHLDSASLRQPRLKVDLDGVYVVTLVVNDGISDSAPVSATISVGSAASIPLAPGITLTPQPSLPSQDIQLSASTADPKGLPLSYRWQFSDGSTANGANVSRRYASAGSYEVSVVATNSQGVSSEPARATVRVVGQIISTLPPACLGANCGAAGVNRYTGTGTGIWSQTNTTAADQAYDLDIDNIAPERAVTLLISNGSSKTAISLPDFGRSPTAGVTLSAGLRRAQAANTAVRRPAPIQARQDEAYRQLRQRNEALLRAYAKSAAPQRRALSVRPLAAGSPGTPPALQSSRTWKGSTGEADYETSAEAVCALPGGRHAVFWVDTTTLARGLVTPAVVNDFASFFCGNAGAYARLIALTGDVWGSGGDATLIGDDRLQDVNIVLGDPKGDVYWGGYFDFSNNFRKSSNARSNEALVFFLNMRLLGTMRHFLMSTLVHETMHMVNAYQRTVRQGVAHASWLEETTAMMSEDLVVPALLKDVAGQPYDDIGVGRLPYFMWTGGAVSYTADPLGTSIYTYSQGGSFGAFLNRRYGSALFKRLLNDCKEPPASQDSYACMDSAITQSGGTSFANELDLMLASTTSSLSPAQSPAGFGFPQRIEGDYLMPTLDPSYSSPLRPERSPALESVFGATTFVYISDAVPAGSTRYRRQGVIVPPGSTLMLIVR